MSTARKPIHTLIHSMSPKKLRFTDSNFLHRTVQFQKVFFEKLDGKPAINIDPKLEETVLLVKRLFWY